MGIIRDSSIWRSQQTTAATDRRDNNIRTGIVREVIFLTTHGEMRYIVEVNSENRRIPVLCTMLTRFGGPYNYEEYTLRSFKADENAASFGSYAIRAGDTVVVAFLNGKAKEGVILGCVRHPSRQVNIRSTTAQEYISEFNGVRKSINDQGEYKVEFRGVPTNAAKLNDPPKGDIIPIPTYNESVGTSFYKFDKTGSWIINDNAQSKPQFIKIDKSGGTISLSSGNVVLQMQKGAESVDLTTKITTINSQNTFTLSTKQYKTTASASVSIKSPKIAIGTDGTELIDQLIKLIDALALQTIITPVGPASPVNLAPQWSQILQVRTALNKIKGTL